MTTAIICGEYISREPGVKLVRTPDIGWRSAALNGEVIDDLTVEEVTVCLKEEETFEEVALCPDCRQPLGADDFCPECSILPGSGN